jgi:peroxiredoxin
MTTPTPTIAAQAADIGRGAAAALPVDVVTAFGAEQARLDAAGIPAGVVSVGTVMPDAELLDASGKATTLHAALGGRMTVVVFYRGAWCPFCNVTLGTYQRELMPALLEGGVGLVAISPQKPDGSLTMQEEHDLTFPVLSDPGNTLARQLGIVTTPGADIIAAQSTLGLDVAAGNANGTHELPMPTVVIADPTGVIRWIDVHPNYTTRTEVADILHALQR